MLRVHAPLGQEEIGQHRRHGDGHHEAGQDRHHIGHAEWDKEPPLNAWQREERHKDQDDDHGGVDDAGANLLARRRHHLDHLLAPDNHGRDGFGNLNRHITHARGERRCRKPILLRSGTRTA